MMLHQWNKTKHKLLVYLKRELNKISNNSFKNKSFGNKSWKPNKKGIVPSLIKTHKMKNSIKFDIKGNNSIKASATGYAKYQNEGTETIPKREFMGVPQSELKEIHRNFNKIIKHDINLLLKDMFKKI